MAETNLKNDIPLVQFIKKVNESFGTTGQINQAIFQASFDLAEKIHSSLRSIEILKLAYKQNLNSTTPVGVDKEAHQICPENGMVHISSVYRLDAVGICVKSKQF